MNKLSHGCNVRELKGSRKNVATYGQYINEKSLTNPLSGQENNVCFSRN